MTKTEILARYTDEEKRISGSVSHKDDDWHLYDFWHNEVICPECFHPCNREFYSCGDPNCCTGHCWSRCGCMWSPRGGDHAGINPDDAEFEEIEPGRWTVDFYTIHLGNGSSIAVKPIKDKWGDTDSYIRGTGWLMLYEE